MSQVTGNQITGISTSTAGSHAVYKQYVDNIAAVSAASSVILPIRSGNESEFLYSNGTATSWEPSAGYVEYSIPGDYTFTIPTQATSFLIDIVGAGGGGDTNGGGGGGGYARCNLSRSQISGTTLDITVGAGGSGQVYNGSAAIAGTASTVRWTSPAGIQKITANGGSSGITQSGGSVSIGNYYFQAQTGGAGGAVNTSGLPSSAQRGASGGGGGGKIVIPTALAEPGGRPGYAVLSGGQSPEIDLNGFDVNNVVSNQNIPYGNGGRGGDSVNKPGYLWKLYTNPITPINTVSVGPGLTEKYIAGGTLGQLSTSTDALVWTLRTSSFSPALSYTINTSLYDGSLYFLFGGGASAAIVRSSTNGIQWGSVTTTGIFSSQIVSSNYATGQTNDYIAIDSLARIGTSVNGTNWTLRTSGFGAATGVSVFFGGTFYLAGANQTGANRTSASTDGIRWTLRTNTNNASFTFVNNLYVSGRASFISASTDTISWTTRTSGVSGRLLQYLFSDTSQSFALYDGGIMMASTDTVSWITANPPFSALTSIETISYNPLVTPSVYILGGSTTGSYAVGLGTTVTPGGQGYRGGGGGGGAYNSNINPEGTNGGKGGDGYVKITWY